MKINKIIEENITKNHITAIYNEGQHKNISNRVNMTEIFEQNSTKNHSRVVYTQKASSEWRAIQLKWLKYLHRLF